jgi:hypothetical protein
VNVTLGAADAFWAAVNLRDSRSRNPRDAATCATTFRKEGLGCPAKYVQRVLTS